MIEAGTLPQIVDLDNEEIAELLQRTNFGHLGLSRNDRPYVIPIHFAYGRPGIFFYTTEGLKTEIIEENPSVCLQVEEVKDDGHWKSVIITGTAELLTTQREIDHAMDLIKKVNPELVPAWSIRWLDDMIRANHPAVFRISAETKTGRMTLDKTS
jgi:nitroimidazol reductase NimA-like FMN-containing flavoprotein (pyridoxamine 5'-phosphate oxidase superfamily)